MSNSPKSQVRSPKLSSAVRVCFYLLISLVPLIMYSGTSELFEFNKMLFIYAIAAVVGAIWSFDLILNNRKIVYPKLLSYSLLFFLLSQIASTFFSIDFHTSLFGYYGRFNGGLFSIIAYMVILYTFIQYFNEAYLEKLLRISVATSAIVVAWGLPGKFGYDLSCLLFTGKFNNTCWTDQFRPSERMFSTLGQPNWLGAYLAIHFFIGIYFLIRAYKRKNLRIELMMLGYTVLNFSAVLFTRSRSTLGAVLICLAILPFCLAFLYRQKTSLINTLKIYLYIILLVVLSVLVFQTGVEKIDFIIKYLPNKLSSSEKQIAPVQKESQPTLSKASGVTDSFDIRKVVWKGAADLGKKYPLFGTGVETFAYSYYFVRPVEHNLTSEWDFLYNKAHNEFLNYFATTGYTGLAAYILMIVVVFYSGVAHILTQGKNKPNHTEQSLLIICLLLSYGTIHITNFFGFSTTSVQIFFYLIPGFIFILNKPADSFSVNTSKDTVWRKALLVLPTVLLIYILFFLVQYFMADIRYNAAESSARAGEYQQAAVEYNNLMQMHYEHVYEDKLSYVLANLTYVAAYQKEKKTADNLLQLAQFYNRKSLQASPSNINYWKTTVKNDYLFYQSELDPKYIEHGLDSLKIARGISPTDPKLPYSEALFYSVLEDEAKDPQKKDELQQKSIASINTAIKLKSDYRDSYFLKGQLLKKYGNIEEARKTFQFILDHINPSDEEVKKEISALSS